MNKPFGQKPDNNDIWDKLEAKCVLSKNMVPIGEQSEILESFETPVSVMQFGRGVINHINSLQPNCFGSVYIV